MPLERRAKGLNDGDHAGPGVGFVDGGDHHLADGVIGESNELSQ